MLATSLASPAQTLETLAALHVEQESTSTQPWELVPAPVDSTWIITDSASLVTLTVPHAPAQDPTNVSPAPATPPSMQALALAHQDITSTMEHVQTATAIV